MLKIFVKGSAARDDHKDVESNENPRMMVGGDEWSQLWSLPAWVGSITRDHELSGPGPIFWALVYLSAKWGWSYYQSKVAVIRFK